MIVDWSQLLWVAGGAGVPNQIPLAQGLAAIHWSSEATAATFSSRPTGGILSWPFEQLVLRVDPSLTVFGTMAGSFNIRVQWSTPINPARWMDDTFLTPTTAAGITALTPSVSEFQFAAPAAGNWPAIWTLPVMGEQMRYGVYCSAAPQNTVTQIGIQFALIGGNQVVQP